MTEYTYVEKDGIGYKAKVEDIAKLLLKDYMEEVLSYPAGGTVIEEINVDGVIIHMANGKEIAIGTYPLYEEYNNITTPTYNLPNYLEKPNIISNFPNSGKNVGDTIDWQVPSHVHPESSYKIETTAHCSFPSTPSSPIPFDTSSSGSQSYFTTSYPITINFSVDRKVQLGNKKTLDSIVTKFQPEKLYLSPYIIVDYRG